MIVFNDTYIYTEYTCPEDTLEDQDSLLKFWYVLTTLDCTCELPRAGFHASLKARPIIHRLYVSHSTRNPLVEVSPQIPCLPRTLLSLKSLSIFFWFSWSIPWSKMIWLLLFSHEGKNCTLSLPFGFRSHGCISVTQADKHTRRKIFTWDGDPTWGDVIKPLQALPS